jgi:hypothetical protein
MPEVAFFTTCAVCHRQWLPDADERWRAYHLGDDLDEPDEPAELVFYCSECAKREFGGD